MKLEVYPDREALMLDLADRLAGELGEALMLNEQASLVVPGGSTPGPVFDALSAVDLDWSRVTVLPSDERWVPESAPESNARLIRERLLVGRAAKARFLPFFTGGDGAEAVPPLTAQVAELLPFSVVLLGMGSDMHIASLFPGQAALRPENRQEAGAYLRFVKVPGLEPKVSRMTLTVQALNAAQRLHIVMSGSEKRAALEEAHRINDPFQAPVSAVLKTAVVHWAE
jgi:6-phosphogluconolactonase